MDPNPYAMPENQTGEYYGEGLDSLPFDRAVKSLRTMLPAPVAYGIATYMRIRRLFGLRPKPQSASGPVGSGTDVAAEEMPPRAMSRWAGMLEQLHDLGFQPLSYTIPDLIGAKEAAYALFLDEPGSTLLTLEWQRIPGGENQVTELTPIEFNSYLMDGGAVLTGLVAEEHLAFIEALRIEFIEAEFFADKMKLKRCYAKHQERIANRKPMHFAMETAKHEHEQHAKRRFDQLIEDGLMFQLNEKQIQFAKQQRLPNA